jgi:hypothetical protein
VYSIYRNIDITSKVGMLIWCFIEQKKQKYIMAINKNKLEEGVSFLLKREKLKKNKDFTVTVKIGGGIKIVVVEFKDTEQGELHREGLIKYLQRENATLEIKSMVA